MIECPILLADCKIFMRLRHEFTVAQCQDYHAPAPFGEEEADLTVEVTDAELEAERAINPPYMSEDYMESICIYRAICRSLPPLGAMMLHSAVIADGDRGYAFTADSGTGKTTHIRLWRDTFGKDIEIINGDKPLIRCIDGVWYAYGTPWCGKECWHVNRRVPLLAICFLRRGETNTIAPYPVADAVTAIMPQLYLPEDPVALMATLDMLDDLVKRIPLYELHCTMSPEAAHVARAGMSGTAL